MPRKMSFEQAKAKFPYRFTMEHVPEWASLEKRKIDRKVYAGKASRKDVLRGLDMLRKSRAQAGQ